MGCQSYEDLQLPERDASWAIPVFQTKVSPSDLLGRLNEQTEVIIDDDGLVRLRYADTIRLEAVNEILEALVFENNVFPLLDTVLHIPLEGLPNNADVDFAILKEGQLYFQVALPTVDTVDYNVEIPAIKDSNGNILKFSTRLENNQAGNTIVINSPLYDMRGFVITPVNDTITVRYMARKVRTGQVAKVNGTNLFVQKMRPGYIQGYSGKETLSLGVDTIPIPFFEKWKNGISYFSDPVLSVKISNSFGFPVKAIVNVFDVESEMGVTRISSPVLDNGVVIAYPSLGEVGEVKVTEVRMDSGNSNIRTALNERPFRMMYDLSAETNPDGNPAIRGHLTDSSFFEAQLEVQLPASGYFTGLNLTDTFQMDLKRVDEIDSLEVILWSENGIPLEVTGQLYFMDDQFRILDSAFTAPALWVAGAKVNTTTGEVSAASSNKVSTTFFGSRLRALVNTRKVRLQAVCNTSRDINAQYPVVKLRKMQSLQLNLGLRFNE
jgi:hypothetical protein